METLATLFGTINSGAELDINWGTIIISLAAALIYGLVISLTYMYTHRNRYGRSMAVTLTMLPVILTMIILLVGSNVARAFSLAGTLSIIRFRSTQGDPQDIGYIFFDIAAGLACGVGLFGYGALFVIILCLFMILLSKTNFAVPKATTKLLKITIPEDLDYEGIFDDILDANSDSYNLIKVKTTDLGSLFELSYSLNMKKGADEKRFIDDLRARNGNLNIVLALADNEPYGA